MGLDGPAGSQPQPAPGSEAAARQRDGSCPTPSSKHCRAHPEENALPLPGLRHILWQRPPSSLRCSQPSSRAAESC